MAEKGSAAVVESFQDTTLRSTSISPIYESASLSDSCSGRSCTFCVPASHQLDPQTLESIETIPESLGDQDCVATAASSKTPSSASGRVPVTQPDPAAAPYRYIYRHSPWRLSGLPVPGPGPEPGRLLVPCVRPAGVPTPSCTPLRIRP